MNVDTFFGSNATRLTSSLMQSMPMDGRALAHQMVLHIDDHFIAATHLDAGARHHSVHDEYAASESVAVNAMRPKAVGFVERAIEARLAQRFVPFDLRTGFFFRLH